MEFMLRHAVLFAFLAPLAAALLAFVSPSGRAAWAATCFGAFAAAACMAFAAAYAGGAPAIDVGGWAAPLGVEWRVDGLGALGAALFAGVAFFGAAAGFASLRSIDRPRQGLLAGLVLTALAAGAGVAAAGDLLTIFLLSAWLWLALAASTAFAAERERRAAPAAFGVFTQGMIAVLLFALGAGFIFQSAGVFDARIAAGVLNAAPAAMIPAAGLGLMLVGAAALANLAPLNAWALAGFARAPAFVVLTLGAAAPIAGMIVLMRLVAMTASANAPALSAGVSAGLSALGAVSVLAASASALRRDDLRKLALDVTAVQAGCVAIGAASASALGVSGGLFHLANQAITGFVLLAAAVALEPANGNARLAALDGLGRRAPLLSAVIALALLSVVGAPMTAGFLSRWALLQAALGAHLWWGAAAIILGSLAAAAYAARLIARMYLAPAPADAPPPRAAAMAPGLAAAAAVTVVFGVAGGWALGAAESAASSLSWIAP